MPPVTIISLLSWDSPTYLRNLLANLDAYPPGRNCHIHIVDQGSQPETVDLLKRYEAGRPYVSIEYLSENIGYGPGHNHSHRTMSQKGNFDYFLTVNNDLVFGEPDWLNVLVDGMEKAPWAGIGGPMCHKNRPGMLSPATREEMLAGDFLFVTGAVAMIRNSAIRRFGLFDEAYAPAYWEDADIAMRYRRFGVGQVYIDIPVFHGYLGAVDRVNVAKDGQLVNKWGDFRNRNQATFVRRWVEEKHLLPDEADLRRCFDQLYIPD